MEVRQTEGKRRKAKESEGSRDVPMEPAPNLLPRVACAMHHAFWAVEAPKDVRSPERKEKQRGRARLFMLWMAEIRSHHFETKGKPWFVSMMVQDFGIHSRTQEFAVFTSVFLKVPKGSI